MKKKLIDLEFIKSHINLIENHLIEVEKLYLLSLKDIQESKSHLRKIYQTPLKEYNKIQIKNLLQYLNAIENHHEKNYKNILKAFRKIEKLKNTSILDQFSDSVQTHIVNKIKKEYNLKPKDIKKQFFYIIFELKSTFYCVYGQIQKILLFHSIDALKDYFNNRKWDPHNMIFPHLEAINFFLPKNLKKIFLGIIYNEKNQKTYYIVFYKKLLCKKKIDNLHFYSTNNKYHEDCFINQFFLDKGKKIYFIS